MSEIYRIMKPGAVFFGFVPFLYYYHAEPGHYQDYYRFTEDGLRYLLREFKNLEVNPVSGNVTTVLNLLPGRLGQLQYAFKWLDRFFSKRQVSGYNFFVQK